ncbi:hypothetical protein CJV57_004436 [Escherichia coli]|nr:hypothetical protein [Escherichia coli]
MNPSDAIEAIEKPLSSLPYSLSRHILEHLRKLTSHEPVIGIMGKSGAGKSSLCNALFQGEVTPVSDVHAGTREVQRFRLSGHGHSMVITDLPGVGESRDRDAEYEALYRDILPELDLVLWLIKADDRALSVDEYFWRHILHRGHQQVLFVVTQADKTEPCHEWDVAGIQPSSGVADTLTGGFDTEELETWRARVIERYYWTPQGGADGDYVVWAKEVPGIARAWTYRHWMGTGTVGVMIASSDLINPIPEESTETAARQHIWPLAPVAGSDLYVFRPVAHTVDFHIRVTPDTPEIRAAITAELRSFLLRDGYPQGELKVSRISEAISGANGEYSHQLLAPVDNISIAKNELAVLGTISWT